MSRDRRRNGLPLQGEIAVAEAENTEADHSHRKENSRSMLIPIHASHPCGC